MLPVLTGLSNNELERVSYVLLINRSMILTLLINFWVLLFCSVTQDRSEKHFFRRMLQYLLLFSLWAMIYEEIAL